MQVLFITSTRIGDAVLASGILAHLVETLPNAHFTIACGPAVAPLFVGVPRLARIIVVKKQRRAGNHWLRLWRETVGTRWHLVVDLRSSALSFALWTRHRRVLSPFKTDEHRITRLSRVMGSHTPLLPRIWPSALALQKAESLLPRARTALALGPTANWHGKQWPIARFIDLAAQLTAEGAPFQDAPILVLGGPGEHPAAAPLLDALGPERAIDLVGTVDLLTAYACLARAGLYIGNDSGLMHLAAAAGIPTVGLFGPSPDKHYAPVGPLTAVVRGEPFESIVFAPDFDRFAPVSYMGAIMTEAVVDAALDLWRRAQATPAGRFPASPSLIADEVSR